MSSISPYWPKISRKWSSVTFLVSRSTTICVLCQRTARARISITEASRQTLVLLSGLSLRERPRPRLGLRTLLSSLVRLLLLLRLSRARPLRRGGERESLDGERRRDTDRDLLLDRESYGDRLRDRRGSSGDRDREGMMGIVLLGEERTKQPWAEQRKSGHREAVVTELSNARKARGIQGRRLRVRVKTSAHPAPPSPSFHPKSRDPKEALKSKLELRTGREGP